MISQLFTDRHGGVSAGPYESLNLAYHVGDDARHVDENRSRVSRITGPSVYMNQSHGDTIVVVEGIPSGEPNADALITKERGIALAVLVADCIPLLLWDEEESCLAAVHVGRKGLVNGIASKVVNLMRQMESENIQALLGPSICGNCYEVSRDIYDEVCAIHPAAEGDRIRFEFSLNLPRALTIELEKLKVDVSLTEICALESQQYFSYRRDGITGRNAGVIWS